ncbi:hypothetical protein B0O99DRAFT_600462 [Bisporella sp. PMI_857]|nr:hypothetical protein B0O99DRAFT_600462 [Bisporella sp. PMI_857]
MRILPLLISFVSFASACLVISGGTNQAQFTSSVNIQATDDGRQTCSGKIGSTTGNIGCVGGYSMWVDDLEVAGRIRVKYGTPHGSWDFTIDKDCEQWACGGTTAPIWCAACTFGRRQFGC